MSTGKTAAPASATKSSAVESSTAASAAGPTWVQRLGNENMQLLLRARLLQAKLTVSNPNDSLEQEADRVAELVMRMPDGLAQVTARAGPRVQRSQEWVQGSEELVQRSEESAAAVPSIDAATEAAMGSLSGRGRAMSLELRAFMEPRFNADFGAVRVHDDAHAHDLARSVGAQAFTLGPNIVFGSGHFAPHTESGKRLLAHELTHTLQQGAATRVARAPAKGNKASSHDAGYSYEPFNIPSDKPAALAARALRYVRAQPGVKQDPSRLADYVLVVVTDRVYLYLADAPDHLIASYELTAPPPIRGIFEGRRGGPRALLSLHGGSNTPRFGSLRSTWGKGEWLTDYSTMTAADVNKHIGNDIPVIIVPEQPVAAPAPVKKTGAGSGGTGKSKGSPGGSRTTEPSEAKPRSEMMEALTGDEYYGTESKVAANYPAFPAHIAVSTPLVPEGGANDVKMMLYWGMDPVMSVWNASTRVAYRWEWWDITEAIRERTKEQIAKDQRQTKHDKKAAVGDMYVGHNRRQRIEEFNDEVQHSYDTIATGGLEGDSQANRSLQVSSEYMNLALAPASALRSAGGHLVDTLWRWATKPENEIQLEWNKQGHFLVRCVATPQEHEGRLYASSVATAFVEVRAPEYIAENTLEATEAALLELRALREVATDKDRIRYFDEQIADLEATTYGSAYEALKVAEKNARKALTRAVGTREKEKAQKQLDTVSKQLTIAERNERGLPKGPDGKPTHALRPRAALISQTTGTTFPLLLQLFHREDNPTPNWVIFDVTTSGDTLGEPYEAEGRTHDEAIENAFTIFSHMNDYGPGLVMMRVPGSIPGVTERPIVKKNVKGYTAATRERLMDLVTVLTAASVVLPGAGMVAMELGGVMAAEHIVRRWRHGTLEADASLVTDIISILGAVVGRAAKVASLRVIREEKAFAIAADVGDEAMIRKYLKKVTGAHLGSELLDIANDVVSYGGIAWGDYQMLKEIEKINDLEREGALTHSQASIQRSKLVLGALQGRVMLAAPLLHRQPGLAIEPPTAASPPRRAAAPDGEASPRPPVLPPGAPKPLGKAGARTQQRPPAPERSSDEASRTMAGIGGGGHDGPPRKPGGGSSPPPQRPPTPPHEASPPVESPEWLHVRLARETAGEIPAPLPPRATEFPAGEFRSGIKRADEAYHAYNEAMSGANGREVGIYYHEDTGEYRVMIGREGGVSPPAGDGWTSLLHFHPNPDNTLTFRQPAPQDFNSLVPRALRTNSVAREFIEYTLPDGRRGRTEFGIDPANAEPYYIRIHHPDGTVEPAQRFESFDAYLNYWSARAVFVEKGSATHRDMLFGARQYIREKLNNRWGPSTTSGPKSGPKSGRRTMTGTSGGGSEPPVRVTAPNVPDQLPAVIYRLPDGDRLVTVHEGRAYYQSLGKSTSHIEGQPLHKEKGAFYEFVGALEVAPPGLTVDQKRRLKPEQIADYEKIGVGWLQKGFGVAPLDPVTELQGVNYQVENNGQPLTTAQELNAWLVSKGMVPWIDYFRHHEHMRGPPKIPSAPSKPPPPVPSRGKPPTSSGGGSPPGAKAMAAGDSIPATVRVPTVASPDVRVGGFGRTSGQVPEPPQAGRKVAGFVRGPDPEIDPPLSTGVPVSVDNADDVTGRVTAETPLPEVAPPELPRDLKVGGFGRNSERVPPNLDTSERPVRGFRGRDDAVPEHIAGDDDTTQKIVMETSRAGGEQELIGDYRIAGVTQMEGPVMHRRIWKMVRQNREPTGNRSIRAEIAAIRTFVELLLSEARQAGATTLRISGELIGNPSVLDVDAFVRALKGTVRRIDAVTIEIVIPVPP